MGTKARVNAVHVSPSRATLYAGPVSHTRVAVVQIDFHPAALVDWHSPLEDPLFQLNAPSSSLPAGGLVPAELEEPLDQLRARIRREHNRCLMLKLRAVLERCRAWGVKLVVLPEYSVGAELLPELAAIAPEMVVVAGTHAVERALQGEGIYAQLGWPEAPRSGMAVAPVLHRGRLLALQPKLSATKYELRNLVLGDHWDPIEFDLGGGPAIPGPLGVMICLDFLFREQPKHREQVGPGLDRVRFLAVPSYTPWHSAGEFAAEAWQEARRYGRPVLWANVASQGGSSIFVDEGQVGELQNFPLRVGLLERGDEGVIVADVDLGYQRVGGSTRYPGDSIVKPVAVASLLYRHHPIGDRYAAWVEEFERRLDTITEDAATALVEGARTLLLEAASLSAGQARTRRIRRLMAVVRRLNVKEEFRQFTREVVLPGAALPLDVLRQVWARECAELVFEWTRAHRGAGLEEVEQRLRAGGKLKVEAELWTETGREALRETAAAIRAEVVEEQSDVPQVRERVPVSMPLVQVDLDGEGLWLVFRASPGELRRFDEQGMMFADSPCTATVGDRRWSGTQLERARVLWLLQRTRDHLDASVVGVNDRGGFSSVLVCVREGEQRLLLAADWGNPLETEGLRERREAILRVAAGYCDDLQFISVPEYHHQLAELMQRFEGARAVIDRAVEFRLRELNRASTKVLARVDDGDTSQVALDELEAWLGRPEQVMLVSGGFGTGKSTLLAQWCQKRWGLTDHGGVIRCPILVDLATSEQREPIDALLLTAGRDPASLPDRAALSLLLSEGELIACFDGFDEMVTRLGFHEVPERLSALLAVANDGGKVLVASRDSYFSSADAIARDMQQAQTRSRTRGHVHLHLQPFGAAQVDDVIGQFIKDAARQAQVREKIHSTYDLEDLVQTPMLLSMVLQTIDELDPGARVGSANVYERYLDRVLAHADVGDPELFSPEQKRVFAEVLAAELWRSGETSLNWTQLHKSVMATLYDVLPTAPPEPALLEIQNGTFLVCEGEDRFRFAHKSFLEFFMAKGLLTGLERSPEQVLDTTRLTPEVAAFVAELLRVRGTDKDDPAVQSLQRWLVGGREGRLEASVRAAANALRLLRDVARELGQRSGWVPDRADLRGVDLQGEELDELRLHGARFGRARLIGVGFRGTDLRGSSLQDADLQHGHFWEAVLDDVDFEQANLSGVEGHACSLRGANFRKVEMRQANWTSCEWGDATVEQATVGPTILAKTDPNAGSLRPPIRNSWVALGADPLHSVGVVAWSPDGRYIASSSYDLTISIWHSHDGRLLSTLQGRPCIVESLAWAPDGLRIASGSIDGAIRTWDALDGRLLSTLKCADFVSSVDWAPDGIHIASASGNAVRIWHVNEERVISTLQGHTGWVTSVAWAPDGTRIASASVDHTICIWCANSGELIFIFPDHSERVNSVAWAPDSVRIASASTDDNIHIWNSNDGRLFFTLQCSGPVSSVAWARDGVHIASTSHDDILRIWNASDGHLLSAFRGYCSWGGPVAWAPDGLRIASTEKSWDGTIRIWNANDGHLLATLQGRSNAINCVDWAPSGNRIASASVDGIIRIWHANDGSLLATLPGHTVVWAPDGVRIAAADDDDIRIWHADDDRLLSTLHGYSRSIAWAPDGIRIAGASDGEYTILIRDGNDGRLVATLKGHLQSVNCVAWAPDGYRIASASDDRTIRIWRADDGLMLSTLVGHSGRVYSIAWSPDGLRVASASHDNTVRIWQADGSLTFTLHGHSSRVVSVAWSPDGLRIASASHDSTVRIWHADDGRLLSTLFGHFKWVTSIAWSPDGRRIASASGDNTVRIWHAAPTTEPLPDTENTLCVSYSPDGTNFASGADDRSLRICDSQSLARTASTHDHRSAVLALTYSPTGEHLASASSDCRIRIFDAKTLTRIHVLAGHTRDATNLAYSPNGKLLASTSGDRTIRLWNPLTGELLAIANHNDWANCVAFSPDGTKIASGSSDHNIHVWSIPNLEKLFEIDAHAHYVNGIAWYPDGERVVSSSWDKTLRIWNANDGRRIHELVGHEAPIRGLAFAPDGTCFASVSDDKTLRIWDAETYQQLEVFHSQTGLRRVAWSPDSAQIIAGSQAGVQIWRIDPCLAILQAAGDTSLVQTPSGQFYLQPESAEAYLEVPRPDRTAVFYLPLAGIRTHQSREAVAHALAGRPTRSLAQTLGWAPVGWDGEVRTIPFERPSPQQRLAIAPALDIITNPFSPDTALRNTSTLPGRRAELDKVVQALRRRGVVWLRGPRRAGKTSLLAFLEGHLAGHRVFTRSLQAGSVKTPNDIAILLVPDLRESRSPADAFWDRLAKADSPVIMLDEIAVLVEAEPQTLRWLRALGQECASLIYSGSHYDWVQVKRRMREVPGSSFGNDVTFVDFGPIPEPDALDFLIRTAPARAPISEELARWVIDECGTWPYYLQVLGYALVEEQTLHRRTPSRMSREDFGDFYRRVLLGEKDNYFDLRWQEFTVRARAILRDALDREILPKSTDLTTAEKRVLRDEGALIQDSWALDKPFWDWMRENRDMLEEEVT